MKRQTGFITIIVLFILVMTAFVNVFVYVPPSKAGTIDNFSDGSSELIINFPGTASKFIKVPADSNVTKCTINFTTLANDDGIYPENIELKFGEVLPIDWAFQGSGHGAYGFQRYFKDSQVRVNLTYDGDQYNDTLSFLVPRDAAVSQASVLMTAFEYDYWEPGITELNIADGQTWQQDPFPFVFQNRLWIFMRNYNSTETDESDADITYRFTTDGINWQPMTELTPRPDTSTPYPPPQSGITHFCGDYHPYVVEFNGDMGVFWGSASFYNVQGWGNGLTNGTDRDIVCRWYDPSTNWGQYIEITHPTENANESHYTKNPDQDDLGANQAHPWAITDQRPNSVVFNNRIWTIWMANNTGNTTFHMHNYADTPEDPDPWWSWNHRGDIIISNSSDGVHWTNGVDLTAGDRWWDIDFAPALCVFKNKLYAIWETNGPRYYNDSGVWKKKVDVVNNNDWDIVYRYTSDGINWSDFIEMTQKNDTAQGEERVEYSYPDEDPRLLVYTDPVTNEERMYCIYRTRNPKITNGTDYDIVVTYTTDGLTWTDPVEMTDKKKNGGFDNKPELTIFNNKLYVVWRREQGERWVDNPDGDIVTRHWDGEEWSELQEVSPFDGDGNGRDDFYANSIGFGGKFYTFWVTRNRGEGWPEGTDGDVVVRSMRPSDLPFNAGLDIGNDGTWEVAKTTEFSDAIKSRRIDLTTVIGNLLKDSTYVSNNLWLDEFGNQFVEIKMNTYLEEPSRIRYDDLKIWYNTTKSVGDGITKSSEVVKNPFADKINKYITTNQEKADNEGFITIKLDVTSPSEGRIKMHDIFVDYNRKPTFKLTKPVDTTLEIHNNTGKINIAWEDYDIDDNANIELFYHKGRFQSYVGTSIVANLKEDDETDSYTWMFNQNDLETETYYSIFGVITDGVNVIKSYAPGYLYVKWVPPEQPWIIITEPNGKNDVSWKEYLIEWEDSGVDGATEGGAKITLFYSPVKVDNISANAESTQIDINKDGKITGEDYIYENDDGRKGQYLWNIEGLPEGSSYYITAIIYDGVTAPYFDCSDFKMARTYIDKPNNFKVTDGKETGPNQYETHNTRPQLTWAMLPGSYLFFITVYEGTSNTGKMIFEAKNITELSIDVDPFGGDRLEYGKTYYSEIYAMNYQGAFSQIADMTFKVVNNLPSAPTTIITPSTPTSVNPLECLEPIERYDIDGDPITYSYKWYKDDVHVEKFDNIRTVPAIDTKKGEEWRVDVTPHDSIGTGTVGSATVIIRNSLPTVQIKSPTMTGKYTDTVKINIHGEATDTDGDSLTVEWYIDLAQPGNLSYASSIPPDKTGGIEALKFDYDFSKGRHNLTLIVRDGDIGIDSSTASLTYISFNVKKGESKEDGTVDSVVGTIAIVIIIIVIIVVVLLLVLMTLRKRKPKTEREKLYGKDLGLKPGEAYPVEDRAGSSDNYFGDDLDRKGVSSFEAPGQPEQIQTTPTQSMPRAEKPPELPPAK